MPNWCTTNLRVKADKVKLLNFNLLIDSWLNKKYIENDFTKWLGNIIGNSGLAKWDEQEHSFIGENGDEYCCRGELIEAFIYNDILHITTETAWSPMLKMWVDLFDKYLKEYELIFDAEELGCKLMSSNDPNLIGMYRVYSENNEIFSDEYTLNELVMEMKRLDPEINAQNIFDRIEEFDVYPYKITEENYMDYYR